MVRYKALNTCVKYQRTVPVFAGSGTLKHPLCRMYFCHKYRYCIAKINTLYYICLYNLKIDYHGSSDIINEGG